MVITIYLSLIDKNLFDKILLYCKIGDNIDFKISPEQ